MSGQQPAAGWYPDPDDPAKQRYWDGQQWTDHRAKAMAVNYEQAQELRNRGARKAFIVLGVVGGAVALFAIASSLTSNDETTADSTTTSDTAQEAPAAVDDAEDESRCTKVPQSVLKELGSGIKLTDGWAVRSDDYNKVWFVAARYVNTWPVFSVNGDPSSPETAFDGLVLAVNEDASNYTPWPYGPDTPAAVSMSDDGAREAELCALGG